MKRIRLLLSVTLFTMSLVFSFGFKAQAYEYEDEDEEETENHVHEYYDDTDCEILRYASLTQDGILRYKCEECGATIDKTVPWDYEGSLLIYDDEDYGDCFDDEFRYCVNYDIKSHSRLYRNSKSITVTLYNSIKGGTLVVKIGKKTYTKTLTSSSKNKTVKIKIKKPTYGSKITIGQYYNGKRVGKDVHYKLIGDCYDDEDEDDDEEIDIIDDLLTDCYYDECYIRDHVNYAKKIKKGMTKKQVKSIWGDDYTSSNYSNGWSYWYYHDNSWVAFKHGKARKWHWEN